MAKKRTDHRGIVRQGDVILIPVTSRPKGLTPVERDAGRVVLAYGEVTGHAHAVIDPDVELFDVAEWEDRLLSVPSSGATLTHDEHAPITLEPGDYRARIQREYHPAEIRRVAD